MKIAIIGSRGYPTVYSGYETFVKELSERLTERGIDVTVYCHKHYFNAYPKKLNGINLVYFRTTKKKSLSQFIHSFQSFMHAIFKKYDVVLVVNSANGPFGMITKLFRIKTAINVDGLEWLRPKWKGLGAKYFYWASKVATKCYDHIITDSLEMQKVYKEEFKSDSIMIAYGANIRTTKNEGLIKRWELRSNEYYLIVGRLIPDNNASLIVDEFVKSQSKKKMVIVGDVPYKDQYAEEIKNKADERILFTGYVTDQDELAELYHHCYVYFHGHEFGGTNPALLKALAYGCAVCALDTRFNREMLADESYGSYFSKEPLNLCRKIQKLEKDNNLIKRLKEKSRDRIVQNYSWEKITSQYIELFNRINPPK